MSQMCSIVVLGLLKLNIKARHDVPEFLSLDHKSFVDTFYRIGDKIGVEIFSLHTNFAQCSLSSQLTSEI